MSDAALDCRRRIPHIALSPTAVSPSLIRWTLRLVTVMLFGAATAIGVSLGLSAPESSPTLAVDHHVASNQ
jgi:hypothetical protein